MANLTERVCMTRVSRRPNLALILTFTLAVSELVNPSVRACSPGKVLLRRQTWSWRMFLTEASANRDVDKSE